MEDVREEDSGEATEKQKRGNETDTKTDRKEIVLPALMSPLIEFLKVSV